MTFLQLKNLVAYYLDDLQFGYFTETQVELWLNNAQQEVQKRLIKLGQNYYLKCVQTSTVINQRDYVLPDDFKKLHRLVLVVSGTPPNEALVPLIPITLNQQDLVSNKVGQPGCYYFKKNRLVLQPAPDQILPLRLYYSYEVVNMVLPTDVPDVPHQYHELIALLAAEDGFLKDGRSSELLQKKLSEFKFDMDQDANERNQDQPRTIVDTGDSDYPGEMLF